MIFGGIFGDSQLNYARLQWQLADRVVKAETYYLANFIFFQFFFINMKELVE